MVNLVKTINTKTGFMIMIGVHIVFGILLKFSLSLVALAYAFAFILMFIDVVYHLDRNNRAGFYALYLMGFEMAYRMAGAPYSWELGKYFSILILLTGLIIGRRKYIAWPFILLLVLLIPAFFLAENSNPHDLRSMIMFNASGPLSLVMAGLYFYKRPVFEEEYFEQLRFAVLPAFTFVAGLSVVANIADLQFVSVQSSAEAAGGFGPNQVSSILGWFILLVMLFKINSRVITPYAWLDWVLLFYLVLRALLTFSRGGVLGSALALMSAILVLYYSYSSFRAKAIKSFPYVFMVLVFFVGVFLFANSLTNNFLLYRYEGKSTSEVRTGINTGRNSLLTGRDQLMKADFKTFKEFPVLGVGFGMGASYRAKYYGMAVASHTEYTRFLSEHGLLGLIFMVVGMLIIPLRFFHFAKHPLTRCFFVAFILISLFTMFHAAMRLALPGVVFGAAFMRIIPESSEDELT